MELWAIIPVKPIALGKSRLAGVLNDRQRAALNQKLFDRVFDAAAEALGPRRTIVITCDTALLVQVRDRGAHPLDEKSLGGLIAALALANDHACRQDARAIAVLPADLPDITSADFTALEAALTAPPCCVIAPDAAELGTNALALAPPQSEFFRFGPGSFAAHVALATERGLATHILRRPGLAHDLDTPEDYWRFVCRSGNNLSWQADVIETSSATRGILRY
jgi:2-phospho-L-lactate guanylyltransferase